MSAAVNEKMTAIADAIRAKTGGTEKLGLDDMPAAIESIETGGGGSSEADYLWQNVATLSDTFKNAQFPANYAMTLNLPSVISITNVIQGAANLTKLTLIGGTADHIEGAVGGTYCFTCGTVTEIDFSNFRNGGIKFGAGAKYPFYGCTRLKYVRGEIDPSLMATCLNFFYSCGLLEEVRFKQGTINKDFSLPQCRSLSTDSLQSIIDGLADLSGQTAQTLTLHADAGAKLTDAQKAAASAKNWTLAY